LPNDVPQQADGPAWGTVLVGTVGGRLIGALLAAPVKGRADLG
jgi:hypothetical protein